MLQRSRLLLSVLLCCATFPALAQDPDTATDYAPVHLLFRQHCLDCHSAEDPEANLVLESHELLLKGGESGPALEPGNSEDSLLVRLLEGRIEKDGKQIFMPPGRRDKLDTAQIRLIREWIDAGAQPPAQPPPRLTELDVPKIEPTVPPRPSIRDLAYAPAPGLVAAALHGRVELISPASRRPVRVLEGCRGSVNRVVFSADGRFLFAAAGEPALFGEVRQFNVSDGSLIHVFEGHTDALHALALSPDDKTLATGSYDQSIILWDVNAGLPLRTLTGHNGAVFDLAFRRDGRVLASVSADRTVKLWHVESGRRLDTLAQSLKELHAVAFSPDGKHLFAAGVDNRIRVWSISEDAAETTNPILHSKYAHEAPILNLAFSTDGKTLASSAQDRSVKLWDAGDIRERSLLDPQSDWAPGLAFLNEGRSLAVGRLDGTLDVYASATGKKEPPPGPALSRAEPRGIQRGRETRLELHGQHLFDLTELKLHHDQLDGDLLHETSEDGTRAWIRITAAGDLPRGPYELSVANPNGESGRIKIHVDDIPQLREIAGESEVPTPLENLPAAVWGRFDQPGDVDEFLFTVEVGDSLVFDVSADSLGSKANVLLTLFDPEGLQLASQNLFDGAPDPFLHYTFTAPGQYRVRIQDLLIGASPDHYYRLTLGNLPYVTAAFPPGVPVGTESRVTWIGHNLPDSASQSIHPDKPGDVTVTPDPERFRSRGNFRIAAHADPHHVEREPNEDPQSAPTIALPAVVIGRIHSANGAPDQDCFRFEAGADEEWILETDAARRGSPVDTRLEVLHADGSPVQRLLFQAVRDTFINFRAIDSNTAAARLENYEEMELNQFLYLQGEVVRLFRMPQGPDSDMLFYSIQGNRRAYFDTSATAHALDEPAYIVEPHPPGTRLVPNGLPELPLFHANDDDGERKLGRDSKLHFTAPTNGTYLVRVTDTRGLGGDRFVYRLLLRKPQPRFQITLGGDRPTLPRGSGQSFTVSAERIDGFDGPITVEIDGLPEGLTVTSPLIIESGHNEAKGTLFAATNAPDLSPEQAKAIRVAATARVAGETVAVSVKGFQSIQLAGEPQLFVSLLPPRNPDAADTVEPSEPSPLELTIAPGGTLPARIQVRRNGHDELITFNVDNLPHGVIVDNIGLNGVLIPKDQDEREIFLTAAGWVPETSRWCYAIANEAGKQTSMPVLLHVRKSSPAVATTNPEPFPQPAKSTVSFSRNIAPVLANKCLTCHGPEKPKGRYRLDSFARLLEPGASDASPIVPGDADSSLLFQLIATDDEIDRMPQKDDPLADSVIAIFKTWINEGALFDGTDPSATLAQLIPDNPHPLPPTSYSHPVPVQALSFHPSGHELAIGGYHEIRVRDPSNGRLLRRITNVTERVHGLAHNPDGSRLAVAGGQPGRGGEVSLYDSSTGDRLRVLARATDVFLCVAFSPDGSGIAAGGSDQSIRVLDVETGEEKLHIRQHADWVMDVVFNTDGSRIASASRDRSARLYDASRGELLIGYMEHESPVRAIAFAGDDRVISADREGRIHIWKAEDGSRDGKPLTIEGRVLALRVEGDALFTASTDHQVRQHRLSDRKLERTFSGHDDWAQSLSLHPATARLAAGAHNGEVLIWSTDTGERLTRVESLATEHRNATAHIRANDPAAGATSQTGNP